jgi:hypothetical protein
MYEAAKNANISTPIPKLNGGQCISLPTVGTLIIEGDNRWSEIKITSDVSKGLSVSYSFDPETMSCKCCGKFDTNRGRGKLVWVFSDQNFSPILPSRDSAMKCIKIIRSEGGDLMTLVSNFLMKYGSAIKGGDVVLIGSANQLLREGLEGYVGSLLDTMDRVSVGSRNGCTVLPAPFILLGGCENPLLIKYIMDLHSWVRLSGVDGDGILNDTYAVIEHHIKNSQRETKQWSQLSFKLPLNIPSRKKTCVAGESANLPVGADPVPERVEILIIHSLVGSLNSKLGTNLDCIPSSNRDIANSEECYNFVTVGGPHAEELAKALQGAGMASQHLHMPHYRASSVHAGKILEGLAQLEIKEDTIIVVQVFDSGIFWVKTEEGGLIPPCRRADGSYHIDGELEVVNKGMQFDLFRKVCDELLDVKKNRIIFMAPLPRYLETGCCQDIDHVSNMKLPDYKKKQEEAIFASRQNIKDFAFRQGLRNSVTISSWGKVRHVENLWNGPTLLSAEAYKKLGEAVISAVGDLTKKRKTDLDIGGQSKRARLDQQTGHGAGPSGQQTGYGAGQQTTGQQTGHGAGHRGRCQMGQKGQRSNFNRGRGASGGQGGRGGGPRGQHTEPGDAGMHAGGRRGGRGRWAGPSHTGVSRGRRADSGGHGGRGGNRGQSSWTWRGHHRNAGGY